MKRSLFLVLLLLAFFAEAQQQPFAFHKQDGIKAFGPEGDTLQYAFAGGMNNCQFGAMDLDLDGLKDLVVFDRHGNRVITFLRKLSGGSGKYVYAPAFASFMPPAEQWMNLLDYNGDGKEDVFTYTVGGIKVYRNDSDTAPRFTQVTRPYLVSQQGSTLTNILVTPADYPGIADIDHDGDLDILTFWGLGSFVEWHRNLSVENYGTPDSLVFQKATGCWGHFAEGVENNIIKLDTCPPGDGDMAGNSRGDGNPKHTGSTLYVDDLNADGLPDLVLGDVDYPSLVALTNGGTLQDARMTGATSLFPNPDDPVSLVSFPSVNCLDVNGDGFRDLLVSPFDPGLYKSANLDNSWCYLSDGADGYSLSGKSFLQDEMIDLGSGAYPAALDYNHDGLMDLVVGNYGYLDSSWFDPVSGLHCAYVSSLALFLNTGTPSSPAFQLVNTDLAGLSALELNSIIPAPGDLDGDGDIDLVCGNSKGKLVYLQNNRQPGGNADFVLADPAFGDIDAGDFSAPQLIDLDRDQLPDLVMGKKNGKLSFYRNAGTQSDPRFTLVTDTLGGVNVTNSQLSYYGYSTPCFFRGKNDSLFLAVGSEWGELFLFTGIEGNLDGKFRPLGPLKGVHEGWRTGCTVSRFDNDTLPDLLVGNFAGGLGYFTGSFPSELGISDLEKVQQMSLRVFPNPASERAEVGIAGLSPNLKAVLKIYALNGVQIWASQPFAGKISVCLSGFPRGVFLIKAEVTGTCGYPPEPLYGKLVKIR